MKSFEVWINPSNGNVTNKPTHILEADKFSFGNGICFFYNQANDVLHAIVATPGMLIRTSKERN
jgi:hypothetical protein